MLRRHGACDDFAKGPQLLIRVNRFHRYEDVESRCAGSFQKTSGATGFHIFIPVEPVYTYEQLRTFGEIIARTVTAQHPNLVTNERSVAKRPAGRVLIDVQQNAMGRPLAAEIGRAHV